MGRNVRRRKCCCWLGGLGYGRRRTLRGLALRFALFLFDNFLAQFAFGGEGAAIDDTKRFFFLVVRQGMFLSRLYSGILALGFGFG